MHPLLKKLNQFDIEHSRWESCCCCRDMYIEVILEDMVNQLENAQSIRNNYVN